MRAGELKTVKLMAVLRSDIEKALDELTSNEEGMRFQGLAVVLAKQRWPDLVACERKKDLGADALGERRTLACSLTATLKKIRDDALETKKHFDGIEMLVFATPAKVTNTTAEPWKKEIREKFGYELVVMSREDIIASLMDPKNAALCRTHLGLHVASEPGIEELVGKVNEATREVIKSWSSRITGRPLIDLRAVKLGSAGTEANEVFQLSDIRRELEKSQRIVLEAPAGRGKTTTLVQLADRLSSAGNVVFVIDLPVWMQSGKDVLSFIAGIPAFQALGLGAERLARLHKTEHSFLLNGWNEIAESDSSRAGLALRELDQNFPTAGIVVATRTHHIVPPLPGALRLRLLLLNRSERARYLQEHLGKKASELRAQLDTDPVLDDLTRTPLLLSEVTAIFEQGAPIPKTKIGVLAAAITLHEQAKEHSTALATAPLNGRAADYLAALAENMTARGAVTVDEGTARTIVSTVGARLQSSGQITQLPEPTAILAALCGHHLLEREEYPALSFRFVHQQFQEFYVATQLKRRLQGLTEKEDAKSTLEFTKQFVNEPAWEEPLRMIAEEIGSGAVPAGQESAVKMGALLLRMALKCDPVYAAELSYYCGTSAWAKIRVELSERLRLMYGEPDQNMKDRALSGMLATGSSEFSDIILPLLTSDDQQVRLTTYRMWHDFHLTSLGNDWQKKLSGWKEEIRAEFVSDLFHFGNPDRRLVGFALHDSSTNVRVAALSALAWITSREEFGELLGGLTDEIFDAALQELPHEAIPAAARGRALAAFQRFYAKSSDPLRRLHILLQRAELGETGLAGETKEDLKKCAPEKVKQLSDFVLKPLLDLVRSVDSGWVSAWVAERIVDGTLWHERWIAFITTIPAELRERLLHKLEAEDLSHVNRSGSVSVLAASADGVLVRRIFAKLCELQLKIDSAPDERHDVERAIETQLTELFHSIRHNVAVNSLAERFSGDVDATDLTVAAQQFGRMDVEAPDLRDILDEKLRKVLRDYFRKALPLLLQREDYAGSEKAYFATALAQVGEPEDIAVLQELIRADIARMRKGREAKAKGDHTRLGNGGNMSYSNWHVKALVALDREHADSVLLDLLKEPEYERDAAGALLHLASTVSSQPGFGRRKNYRELWEARAGMAPNRFDEGRKKHYASALAERIEQILEVSAKGGQTAPYDFRLKELTKVLAAIDSLGSKDLVIRVLLIPGRFNGWRIVEPLETLLFNGVVLPTAETLQLIDAVVQDTRQHYSDQEIGLLIHGLCLLPFVDNSSAGIHKVGQVIAELKLRKYQLRDLATALGNSRCDEALALLRELASDEVNAKLLGDDWINAVAALDSPEAKKTLLSFVDPDIPVLPFEVVFDRDHTLPRRLVELALRDAAVEQRLIQLCTRELQPARRALLAKVMAQLDTVEARLAGLNLIDDNATPPILYETRQQVEATFIEHKPHGKDTSAYTLAPRSSNAVRARLFEMTKNDKNRTKAASALLAQIEIWRLEHGRPNDEPRSLEVESQSAWPTVPVDKLQPDAAHG